MIASGVAKRYARALFELAVEKSEVDQVGQALRDIAQMLEQNAELRALFDNPKYLPETKRNVIDGLLTKLGAPVTTKSALKMLVDRGRLAHLRSISDVFDTMAEDAAGRIRAEIISAGPLPEAYFQELEKTLSEATGRKVTLVRREDPSLIGGVVAKVGDTVFDGSIKNRLLDIRHQMLVAASPHGRV